MAVKYVDNFEFPSSAGFTGSAGKQPVKGYMRGGAVRRPSPGKAKHVGGHHPAKEYPASKAHQQMPPKIEKAISAHESLKVHGQKMGFAYGGQVKTTRTSMDSMDDGVQPAQPGRNQAEIEAGGTKRLKPGYKKGGKLRMAEGGSTSKKAKSSSGDKPPSYPGYSVGTGAAARAVGALKERDEKQKETIDNAMDELRKAMGLSPTKKS